MSTNEMAKAYEPAAVEKKWYPEWEQRGYFHADPESSKPPYSIVIPPPNVTGMLTLGHVLNNTLQDILIRWKKMQGYETCWVPGTDHAGIATQAKVEHHLLETEGVSRYDLGREEFLERVWEWKRKYGGTIINQLRRLGTACDWERERFTLDDGLSNAVEEAFIHLYNKGLIYKGHRIINWCPKSRTALSDEEVSYREENGKLWQFSYPLTDGSGALSVATTRPETMLGDTAVAVHPEDERYKSYHGKTVTLPLVNREIPIVCDEFVDKEFGTGAVKVTPAHDPNDYEMGLRHQLPVINIMHDDGTMNADAGQEYEGLTREECRRQVLADLRQQGLLEKEEDYTHQVGYSERGDVPVEPRLSEQWFVKMKPLAEPALNAVVNKSIRFYPERWVKTYRHWMENVRDWCISRQLWWGHRIPAYYCAGCGEIIVDKKAPEICPACHTREFHQDEDVLDTWFSSWLWPFSVFGWPETNASLARFYPTQALVTGPDIIFFWVARMIVAGLEFMDEKPFDDVYFTSIIRDEQGRKLSKSLNNSPDPIDVMETYGADALRFTMVYISPMGQDLRYSNEKCEIGRNFANKMWNAVRFRRAQGGGTGDWQSLAGVTGDGLRADDKWIIARTDAAVSDITEHLKRFEFHDAGHAIYEFAWNEFCDWYIESAKAVLNEGEGDEALNKTVLHVFDWVLAALLRLLHPIMPFVTEELYHQAGFAGEDDSIMLAPWPESLAKDTRKQLEISEKIVSRVENKFDLIRQVRNIKADYQIPPTSKIPVIITPAAAEDKAFLEEDLVSLRNLLFATDVEIRDSYQPESATGTAVASIGTAYLPLADVIDVEAEKQRLKKQEDELLGMLEKTRKKLGNEQFLEKAPAEVVNRERERLEELNEKIDRLRRQRKMLN
ncbi:MAG: valine--tRNA ligase [Verrucomicrobiota bacterium]